MNAFDPKAVERGVTLSAAIEAATDEEAAGPDGFVRIEASDALWMGLAKAARRAGTISAPSGSMTAACTWPYGTRAATKEPSFR